MLRRSVRLDIYGSVKMRKDELKLKLLGQPLGKHECLFTWSGVWCVFAGWQMNLSASLLSHGSMRLFKGSLKSRR